ncbi:actin cytoskeleton-regulatory complex protein End3p [Trichomonascus vanleenenianus]|uniref:End3p n=1 Tax=Trichomonascus vanleenenianus TaxID=2268995 RepID=UPI003ECAA954
MSQRLEEWEINKYWEIFSGLNPENGLISGEKAAPVLKNSRLGDEDLEKIWDLADVDSDGCLDFEEFCIAMRLIFDKINGSTATIPDTLPEWLVPSSKAHLVTANQAVRSGPAAQQQSLSYDNDDDDLGLSSDFDWYITRADRDQYSSIYSANADYRGMISFDALTELYQTLEIPETDIRSAWNLVNPRSDEKIEREQCVVFLHILNQRYKGMRVPRMVPASLRATFEKSRPEYSLDSKQSIVSKTSYYDAPKGSTSAKKSAFAENYLSRLGLGGRSRGYETSGTDFSATKDTDWEEARLKRKLADLEDQIRRAEEAADRRKRGIEDYGSSHSALVRRELEQLLDYKEGQLRKLRNGEVGGSGGDLSESKEDLDQIVASIQSLKDYQQKQESQLNALKQQIREVQG